MAKEKITFKSKRMNKISGILGLLILIILLVVLFSIFYIGTKDIKLSIILVIPPVIVGLLVYFLTMKLKKLDEKWWKKEQKK